MKKYIGVIFLILSVLFAVLMMMTKSKAVTDEKLKDIPYVKTMMLFPQMVRASISSNFKPSKFLNT